MIIIQWRCLTDSKDQIWKTECPKNYGLGVCNTAQESVTKTSEKEMQDGKRAVWEGFTNSWGKKRSKRKGKKGKIFPTACRVIENSKCWELAYCILSAALSTASSFRIWNSSTRILSLLGASVRHSAHGKGHEEGGSAHAKAGSSLRSPPGNSRASTPKPESAYFRLCALTYTSDFTGAVPHYLSLKKELAYSSS